MLKDVTEVQPLEEYRLRLRFEDDFTGIVDLSEHVEFTGIFRPLRERDYFVKVRVNADIGTICWPNGADVDPDVLYSIVTGEPIPEFREAASRST